MDDDEFEATLGRHRALRSFIKPAALEERDRNLSRSPFLDAAENLLTKARIVLDEDPQQAAAYVERAVRLPFDEREQTDPVAHEAHMLLFNLVSDELEDSDEGEDDWLVAALQVFAVADPHLRAELRDVLEDVAESNNLTNAERRQLRAALVGAPPRQALWDVRLPPQELRDRVIAILRACNDYEIALEDLLD